MKLLAILFLLGACLYGGWVYAEVTDREGSQYTAADVKDTLLGLEIKMAGIKTIETRFIQEKKLAMFKHKIILEGMLFLEKPNHLAWHVQKPVRYSTIIYGDIVRQWDEETDQIHTITLINNPVLGTVIEQMKMWFLGAYVDLQNDYNVIIRNRKPFILDFVPHDATATSRIIKHILVTFKDDDRCISQIRIEEKNGDSTQFTFVDTRLNIPINALAWKAKSCVQ